MNFIGLVFLEEWKIIWCGDMGYNG